jgi:hypothetical protein
MPEDAGGPPAPHEDRPVGQLVSDATEQITRLVRNEMRLAAAELQQKGKRLGVGAGLFGAAGVLALYGGAVLIATPDCGCRTGHPCHATRVYSWISPPSRSRRRVRGWGGGAGGGSGLSGAAWCSARWGRWSLKCATYSASARLRWRRLRISIRSSSSRRMVPIHRSAIAFALGARTGVRRMRMSSLANTASNMSVNLLSRSRIKNVKPRQTVAEVHQEIARLLSNPGTGGVRGDAEEVDAAGGVLHGQVGPGCDAGVATGSFPGGPFRTRRMRLGIPGSPRVLPVGQLPVVVVAGCGVQGVGILLPR